MCVLQATKRKNHSAYGPLQESPVLNVKTIERGGGRGASSVSGKRKVKRERKKTKFSRTQSSAQKRYLWWTDVDPQCDRRRKGQEKREEEEESQKAIYCKACLGSLVRRGDPSCASCSHLFFVSDGDKVWDSNNSVLAGFSMPKSSSRNGGIDRL